MSDLFTGMDDEYYDLMLEEVELSDSFIEEDNDDEVCPIKS